MSNERKVYKIVLLGPEGMGKTLFNERLVGSDSKDASTIKPTLGIDFKTHSLDPTDESSDKYISWDLSGRSSQFSALNKVYEEASIFLVFFDPSQDKSLEDLDYFIVEAKKHDRKMLLIENNRSGSEGSKISSEDVQTFAQDKGLEHHLLDVNNAQQVEKFKNDVLHPACFETKLAADKGLSAPAPAPAPAPALKDDNSRFNAKFIFACVGVAGLVGLALTLAFLTGPWATVAFIASITALTVGGIGFFKLQNNPDASMTDLFIRPFGAFSPYPKVPN